MIGHSPRTWGSFYFKGLCDGEELQRRRGRRDGDRGGRVPAHPRQAPVPAALAQAHRLAAFAGKKITFGEQEIEVEALTHEPPSKAATSCSTPPRTRSRATTRRSPPRPAPSSSTDSGVWRMDPDVPLVVPEINARRRRAAQGHPGDPNCSTTPMVMALWPLHKLNPVKRVIAATYQSVSGTGGAAVEELIATTPPGAGRRAR